ncbi:hypothetical protein Pfo_005255 [Paulownia fortunei]|nr:hypothetical protein Pfo_005255 [Paulownia fortunei]
MEILGSRRRQRLVLVPFPFQGHITPMLQMGAILHSRGFSITIAHTELNSPNPSNNPEFIFLPLSDKLAGCDTSFNNMLKVISDMNTNCKVPFQDHVVQMLEEQQLQGEVACIIYDALMHFVDVVANDLKLPTIVLRTTNAAYIHSCHVMLQLLAEKLVPVPESQLQDAVPRVHPLRFKDLPLPATIEIPEEVQDFTGSYMDIRSSLAVIWNSLDVLEHAPLRQLKQHHRVPFFSMGPFHKMAPALPTSLMKEDTNCLSWLDKQAPNSVIYVSLGSLATIDKKELIEMAWGLANSNQPFLWVVRPSLVNGSERIECLPENFKEITQERGCIVTWAPQNKVLANAAVGGFLSHCGWNSTFESISEGVPMICRPCFSDQLVNSRYLTHVWKVGLELEHVERSSIEKAVRMLMVGKEGKGMRHRALGMKQELELCINRGGSSYKSLDDLVNFIISLSLAKRHGHHVL